MSAFHRRQPIDGGRLLRYFFLPILFHFSLLHAQWVSDVNVNTLVLSSIGDRYVADIETDGVGGAYISWDDFDQYTYPALVYVQHISDAGIRLWQVAGIRASTTAAEQVFPLMCEDGEGGVIVAWMDGRNNGNNDIYAQRLNPDGVRLWGDSGVAVSTAIQTQLLRAVASDGQGGALISWKDFRYDPLDGDVFAQRVDSDGIARWEPDGVPVCALPGQQGYSDIMSDGNGGAFIAWDDSRPGSIYMQHLDSYGTPMWTLNGTRACLLSSCGGGVPHVAKDATTGMIVLWKQVGVNAQRVSSTGNVLWGSSGVPVTINAGYSFDMVSDHMGGAIIATSIHSGSATTNVYAQRINPDGSLPWGSTATAICTLQSADNAVPRLTLDNANGAIITWGDVRNDSMDVYAQHLDSLGHSLWPVNGAPVSSAARTQLWPFVISDGKNGGIFTWNHDDRSDLIPDYTKYSDIYIQNIDQYGYPGVTSPRIDTIADIPSDQGGIVEITWTPSYLDRDSARAVYGYAIFRWSDSLNDWAWLTHIDAVSDSTYSAQVNTSSDSSASGVTFNRYLVHALNEDSSKIWRSLVDSGYSIDNLPPEGVSSLNANVLPDSSVELTWSPNLVDTDIRSYLLIRQDSTNILLPPIVLGSILDTSFLDTTYQPGTSSVYTVVVEDVHDNQSNPSPPQVISLQNVYTYAFSNPTWQLLSIPYTSTVVDKDSIFPGTAGHDAYRYLAGYVVAGSLHPGWGFWLKFSSAGSTNFSGQNRSVDTIPVEVGWNLFGSLSHPIPVDQITTDPTGIVGSQVFGYVNNKYDQTDTLWPGFGYWIKMSGPGTMILALSGQGQSQEMRSLRIQPIFDETPPTPPFDAGIYGTESAGLPLVFSLDQNTPNPFNPTTKIRYGLPEAVPVLLEIFNVLGGRIAILVSQFQSPGMKTVQFDGTGFPSGVYLYRINAGTFSDTKKLLLLK